MAMYHGDDAIHHPEWQRGGRSAGQDSGRVTRKRRRCRGKNFRIDAREGPHDNSPMGDKPGPCKGPGSPWEIEGKRRVIENAGPRSGMRRR